MLAGVIALAAVSQGWYLTGIYKYSILSHATVTLPTCALLVLAVVLVGWMPQDGSMMCVIYAVAIQPFGNHGPTGGFPFSQQVLRAPGSWIGLFPHA